MLFLHDSGLVQHGHVELQPVRHLGGYFGDASGRARFPGNTWMPRQTRCPAAMAAPIACPACDAAVSTGRQNVEPLERRLLVFRRQLHLEEVPRSLCGALRTRGRYTRRGVRSSAPQTK